MTFVQALAKDVPAIKAAVAAHGLTGVTMAPAFLGRVVVGCPDAKAAEVIERASRQLTAA